MNIPRCEHIQTKELARVEKEEKIITDSLAQRDEDIAQKDKKITGLKERIFRATT